MKKITSNLLVITLLLTFFTNYSLQTYALENKAENPVIMHTSEYDMYVKMKQEKSASTLSNANAFSIEKDLLKAKELSDRELKEIYGYDDKQISILRNYDGTAIEDSPELRALLSATLSAYITNNGTTSSYSNISYTWTWSDRPFYILTDMIGLVVNASNSQPNGGAPINVEYTSCSATIKYYTSGNIYMTQENRTANTHYKGNTNVSALSFPMQKSYNSSTSVYAKTGTVTANFKPVVAGVSFGDVKVYGEYGHTVMNISPGFSVSVDGPSLSIEFDTGIEELGGCIYDCY